MLNGSFVTGESFDISKDIYMNPRLHTQNRLEDFKVYPIFMASWEIIVPEALPYPDFLAYLQVITSDIFFLGMHWLQSLE